MPRSKGRPRKPFPVHPERVISRAVQTGLTNSVELQRNIANKITREHYQSSQGIWRRYRKTYSIAKKRGRADYSYILKAEPQIRDNMLKMLYESAAVYGHRDVSRQKNSNDTVSPLNQRLNACGAVTREFSVREFPFPQPEFFGFRTQKSGTVMKQFREAGYEGSSFGPRVTLVHPDLPSLDFGDAARSHNEYLATFCTIHGVSVSETSKYSNLFHLYVRPYLEYIYSEYTTGTSNFQKGVSWSLRRVKELIISAGHSPTAFADDTVTGQLNSPSTVLSSDFFADQLDEAWAFYEHHPILPELEYLITGRFETTAKPVLNDDEGLILTERDAGYLRELALRRSRIKGSIIHRRISDLFPSPWNLRDLILNGTNKSDDTTYDISSEVPLKTALGMGRADLIISERNITHDGKRVVTRPSFVVDIKTHAGHEWFIEPEEKYSESRACHGLEQRVVPNFTMRDRTLSEDEWERIVTSVPDYNTMKQIEVYAEAIAEGYHDIIGEEVDIVKGTLVVDATVDIIDVRRIINDLLVRGYESVRETDGAIKRTVIQPTGNFFEKIALVIHKQKIPVPARESVIESKGPVYTPFGDTVGSEREFILYLSGHSPTSAGKSAAYNAQNYHGLQLLYEMSEVDPKTDFHWIDLADQFVHPQLAEARLRLRPRGYSEATVAQVQPDHIREFFETIRVDGFLDDILSFLYENGSLPSFIFERSGVNRVIIVSGADILRNATPKTHMDRLQQVIDHLVDSLSNNQKTTVLWFDSPVPSTEKATSYGTRTLLPYYDNSILGEVTTAIIWNLPVAPQSVIESDKWTLPTIGDAPMYDDIRVIIRHTPNELDIELTHITLLHGWSKRFINRGSGLFAPEQDLLDVVPDKQTRDRMKLIALSLLPWITALYHDLAFSEELTAGIKEVTKELMEYPDTIEYKIEPLSGEPQTPPRILDLLKLRIPPSRGGLSYVASLQSINSQRLYRSPNGLKTEPKGGSIDEIIESVDVTQQLEQQWLYGVLFESDDLEDDQPFWVVMQHPKRPARMLVGCFTRRPLDGEGYLWALTQQSLLSQYNVEDVLGLPQTVILYRPTEQGYEHYTLGPTESTPEPQGFLSVISRGYGTVGHLRAIRVLEKRSIEEIATTASITEDFYQQVTSALKRYLASVRHPTPVSVHLELVDDAVCRVQFTDENEYVLHQQDTHYSAELISLLRWPQTQSGGMFTDAGRHITWNIFEDIDYGELDFIAPYVAFKAARTSDVHLPERITQFFEDITTIQVSIEHNRSLCPIALRDNVEHDACWRITFPSGCPEPVRRVLEHPMTGEQVNGFLASGRIMANRLYKIDLLVPKVYERDESVVFHEDRYIRILLRQHGLPLKPLFPGTYLQIQDQMWQIEVSWEESGYAIWRAMSTITGLPFRSDRSIIPLTYSKSAEEECTMILDIISKEIRRDRIVEYQHLESMILNKIEGLGYSARPPPCEWQIISSSDKRCVCGLFRVGANESPIITYELDISTVRFTAGDDLIDQYLGSLGDDETPDYHIVNTDAFFQSLSRWIQKHQQSETVEEDE